MPAKPDDRLVCWPPGGSLVHRQPLARGGIPRPRISKRACLGTPGAVLRVQDVVGRAAVERWVKVDQVDRLVVPPLHPVEAIPVAESVQLVMPCRLLGQPQRAVAWIIGGDHTMPRGSGASGGLQVYGKPPADAVTGRYEARGVSCHTP